MVGKVRCAVVGCGTIGAVHAGLLAGMPGAELVSCCDIVAERAAEYAREYGAQRWTAEYREVLADPGVDSVTICTPHYLHAGMVVEAAEAGKHVLVEKPLAMDVAAAGEAVGACRRRGVRLSVCLQNRYNAATVQVLKAIEEGLLGRVLLVTGEVLWYRGEEYYRESAWRGRWLTEGGGVLINQAIHTLDLVSLMGGGVRAVTAQIGTLGHAGIEVEDVATVVLAFESGALGSFVATTCAYPGSEVRIQVIGSEGSAAIVGQELVGFATRGGAGVPVVEGIGDGGQAGLGKDYYGSSHGLVIADHIAAIREGRDPGITGEDGAESVAILAAIYASARAGCAQVVEKRAERVGAPRG